MQAGRNGNYESKRISISAFALLSHSPEDLCSEGRAVLATALLAAQHQVWFLLGLCTAGTQLASLEGVRVGVLG